MWKSSQRFCWLMVLASVVIGCGKEPAGTVASDGAVEVHYMNGRIGKVALTTGKGQQMSDQEMLHIQVSIENRTESTKLEYKGWGGDSVASNLRARLTDDLGNEYKAATFSILQKPVAQKSNESIYPGSSLQDTLLFEVPVDKAQYLNLSLPRGTYTSDVNGPRTLELMIPVASFSG